MGILRFVSGKFLGSGKENGFTNECEGVVNVFGIFKVYGECVCDYVVLKNLNSFENANFIEREFKRILKHQGKLIIEGKL